ncbi:Acyl-coenzyme A thioesterase THEM5, partial [Eschrichtius robustus]|nr:Acyl-coenzyme A thioesterase THEM5 [Eschrichtius robustus]
MIRRGFQVAARLGHHGALPGGPYILPRFSPASAFGSSMDSLVNCGRGRRYRTTVGAQNRFQRSPPSPGRPTAMDRAGVAPEVSRFCQEKTDLKNYTLPNASWCPDMLNLYHEFLEKTKADGWIRLPSFKSNRNHIQGLKLPLALTVTSDKSDCRIFTRCIETEGQGYEYVIFFHPSKKKSVCLFQPGPYLEGPQGANGK